MDGFSLWSRTTQYCLLLLTDISQHLRFFQANNTSYQHSLLYIVALQTICKTAIMRKPIVYALQQGMRIIEVQTVHTDLYCGHLSRYFLWLVCYPTANRYLGCFWSRENYQFFSVNAISYTLGETKSRAHPVFHVLSGCDTTFAFRGKGKKSAW